MHSVGLKETLDIKHGGIEGFGVKYEYLGTSCPVEKLVDAAIETNADAILLSTIITHDDVHIKNMKKVHDLAIEKGIILFLRIMPFLSFKGCVDPQRDLRSNLPISASPP